MPSQSPVFDPSHHYSALDGLRGVAILLVILTHATVIQPTSTFEHALLAPMMLGWCGVDLFFVLSGFLITSILLDTRNGKGYFGAFYARRALRILPLYYVLLALVLIVLPLIPHPKSEAFSAFDNAWTYWTFLSNFKFAWDNNFGHPMLAVTWSLAIEEQFYLLWPLVVLLAGERWLRWLCPALVVGSLLCRLVLMFGYQVDPVALYTLTPCRLDGLALGAWLAALVRGGLRIERHAGTLAVVAAGGYGVVLLSEVLRPMRNPGEVYSYSHFACSAGFTLLSVSSGALLLLALSPQVAPRLGRALSHPVLRSFGKYSYGIYLLHLPARAVLRDVLFGPGYGGTSPVVAFPEIGGSLLLGQALFYVPAIGLCWLMGWVSWQAIEGPFLGLKRRFPYGKARE